MVIGLQGPEVHLDLHVLHVLDARLPLDQSGLDLGQLIARASLLALESVDLRLPFPDAVFCGHRPSIPSLSVATTPEENVRVDTELLVIPRRLRFLFTGPVGRRPVAPQLRRAWSLQAGRKTYVLKPAARWPPSRPQSAQPTVRERKPAW